LLGGAGGNACNLAGFYFLVPISDWLFIRVYGNRRLQLQVFKQLKLIALEQGENFEVTGYHDKSILLIKFSIKNKGITYFA